MRIARLELHGFKSFPDRTSFEFGPGVSCVVGPNGSGKSNVVDAMRWCIGEQSARSLRGAEMLDVIFAGSADRAPVGFAEVKMVLAADTGEPFPGEYARLSELSVARRLHRNGTSEYALNGVKCRRRDIVELFLDTGVGSNLYSFIAQGQVERIVHSAPLERRAIIDEAAGISRYAARRAEAQQRLEATGAQLDRAADVADEMSRRLKVLERQVVRAAEFRRLRALIRQEEIFLSLVRYRELAGDRRALREQLRLAENEAASNKRELLRRETDLAQRREELEVVEAAATKWREEVAELDARRRELEGARTFQAQRRNELSEQADRQEREAAADAERIAAEDRAVAESEARAGAARAEIAASAGDMDARRRVAEDAATSRARARELVAEADSGVARAVHAQAASAARAAAAAAGVDALHGSAQEAAAEAARHEAAVGARRQALAGVDRAIAEAEAAATAARDAGAMADRVVAQAAATRDQRDREVSDAEAALDAARAALDARVAEAAADAERGLEVAEAARFEAEQALRVAIDRGRTELERDLRTATAEVDAAVDEVRRALAECAEADAAVQLATGELDRARAALMALEAAGEAVPGLADGRSVADRLGLDDAEARRWSARVGDRVTLPVASSAAEIDAIAGALGPDRSARVLLGADPDPRTRWDRVWPEFDDRDGAIRHHLAGAGGAVAPGLRIDPDGVAHVGVARSAALDLRAQRNAQSERVAAAEVALASARDAASAAVARVEDSVGVPPSQAMDQVTRRGRERIAAAQTAARARSAAAEAAARDAVERAREAVEVGLQLVSTARDAARVAASAGVEQARVALDHARERRRAAAEDMELARRAADDAARAIATAQLAQSRAEADRRLARAAIAEAEQGAERARAQVAALEARKVEAEAARDAAVADAAALGADITTARAVVEQRTEALLGAEAAEREAATHLASRDAHAAALEERAVAAERALEEATARRDEARARRARAIEAMTSLREAAAAAEQARLDAESERVKVEEQRGVAWDRLQRERERASKLREALSVAEGAGRELQTRAESLGRQVMELETRSNQVRVDLEVLRRGIDDRYQVSLSGLLDRVAVGPVVLEVDPAVAQGVDVAGRTVEGVEATTIRRADLEDAERIEACVAENAAHRDAVAKLGEVNLGALEEFQDLDHRYRDLVAQREDLEASVADIRRAIARMNRTCRQRFRDAFDRVNEFFQEMYPRLVGGGSGRLSLTDEEDLLETGVEIFVQPPGKRLQNLTLLSGGEKAMTAIALLISLFKVKPSPFCVLDEVDAPLDEANGARFNDILREMATVSQFVVITHNRTTMEAADTLYGVTMGRPGVSRLVSVNLAGSG